MTRLASHGLTHRLLLGLPLILALSACKSGGGSGSSAGAGVTGELNLALADAPSQEIDRFEVSVTAIDLLKGDGARVSALPLTTRVDFADLVEVSELLNSASVPVGTYVQIELKLDFTGASVHIAGAAVDANVRGPDGLPLTGSQTMRIDLDDGRPLVIAPPLPRLLTIDFDLDASTTVDELLNTVTVDPVLIAEIDLEKDRIHRVRGPLLAVDEPSASFLLDLRPFRNRESRFGKLAVQTADATHFEVDGVPYDGAAGIHAMAALTPLAAVVARGTFQAGPFHPGRGTFTAESVLAGSSVPGGNLDAVHGFVTKRVGSTLTVAGADLDRAGGSLTFNTTVRILLSPATTRVTREFSSDAVNTDAISVGQEILALGSLSGDAGGAFLTETKLVRLQRTILTGSVGSIGADSFTMNVQRFGRRLPTAFDFSGTGGAGGNADPAHYEVDASGLDLTGIAGGSPVRVFGFVEPFGAAPPDFRAVALVNVADIGAILDVVWRGDSTTQFVSLHPAKLTLDLSQSPNVHRVERAGAVTDLSALPSVSVAPDAALELFYSLKDGPALTIFKDFARFESELNARLALGKEARRICAAGHFDDASGQLSAVAATVFLR